MNGFIDGSFSQDMRLQRTQSPNGKRTALCVVAYLLAVSVSYATWISFDVNELIPDNNEMGIQDTQVVSGLDPIIESLEVSLTLTSASGDLAWNGDFYVSLMHEGGFAVLLNRVGRTEERPWGYDDSGMNIVFSAGFPDVHVYQDHTPSFDADGRLIGTWDVDGRNVDPDIVLDTDPRTATLDSFVDLNPNGEWTLFVADLRAGGTATLDSWGLNITAVPEPVSFSMFILGAVVVWLVRRRR